MDTATLTAIASRFSIRPATTTNPLSHSVELVPPSDVAIGTGGALGLPRVVDVTTYKAGKPMDVDLTVLFKQVRFVNTAIEEPAGSTEKTVEDTVGGMPIAEALFGTSRIVSPALGDLLMEQTGTGTGVPGLLGTVKGLICLPLEVIERKRVDRPARVELRVEVAPAAGVVVDPAEAGPSGTVPGPVSVALPLRYVDLALSTTPPTTEYVVTAAVRLSLPEVAATSDVPVQLPVSTGWVPLAPVTLSAPSVPIPTIVVLFTQANFTGHAMVVVPSNSKVGTSELPIGAALTAASALLGAIRPEHALSEFLTSPAGLALSKLVAQPRHVIVEAADSIHDLSPYEYEAMPRLSAEDSTTSLIVVGRPGRLVNISLERTREDNTASASPMRIRVGDTFHVAMPNVRDVGTDGTPKTVLGGDVLAWGHPGPFHEISALYFPTKM